MQNDEDRPAAVADRADGLVAGLAANGVQQQIDAARNRGTHLLDPVGGAVVEDLAGAQAPQVIVVGRAGHAKGAGTDGRRDLHSRTAHASRGDDEHGFAGLEPSAVDQALVGGPGTRRKQTGVHPLARTDRTPAPSPAASTTPAIPWPGTNGRASPGKPPPRNPTSQGPTPAPRTLITESPQSQVSLRSRRC